MNITLFFSFRSNFPLIIKLLIFQISFNGVLESNISSPLCDNWREAIKYISVSISIFVSNYLQNCFQYSCRFEVFRISLISFLIFSYINYSNIAARLVRQALKGEARIEGARRNESHVKFTPWKDGKPQSKYF